MSDILQHTEDGVLTITFNREARKNSLNRAMYSQLAEIFRSAANDKQVRVAVLQGAENIFTAGNDIADAALSEPVPDLICTPLLLSTDLKKTK